MGLKWDIKIYFFIISIYFSIFFLNFIVNQIVLILLKIKHSLKSLNKSFFFLLNCFIQIWKVTDGKKNK